MSSTPQQPHSNQAARAERVWLLTDLPELSRWLSAEDTRTALLANQQDRNLFIQKAAAMVERSLPMETAQFNTSPAWQQLKRQGYTNPQIAQAFAASWYDQDTQLRLPPPQKNLRANPWMHHLPPVLITFFILIKSFYIWAALYSDCAGEKIRQAIFRGFFPFNGQSFELNPHQKRASLTGCQAKSGQRYA